VILLSFKNKLSRVKNKLIRVLPILTLVIALIAWLFGNIFENEATDLVRNLTDAKHRLHQRTSEYLLAARITDLRRMLPDNDRWRCEELLKSVPQYDASTTQEEILNQDRNCADILEQAKDICGNEDRYLVILVQTVAENIGLLKGLSPLESIEHIPDSISKTIEYSTKTMDSYKEVRQRLKFLGSFIPQEESIKRSNCNNIIAFRGQRNQFYKEWRESGASELHLALSNFPEALEDLTPIINQKAKSADCLATSLHWIAIFFGFLAGVLAIYEKWVE